jgi:hypothetical protein
MTGTPPFPKLGMKSDPHLGPLTPPEIVQEIGCNARPFLFVWENPDATSHMLVAYDFYTMNGKDYVAIFDPDVGDLKGRPYEIYRDGLFRHLDDIVHIVKEGQ